MIEPTEPIHANKDLLLMAFNENLVHNLTFFPDLTCVASGISNVTMKKKPIKD